MYGHLCAILSPESKHLLLELHGRKDINHFKFYLNLNRILIYYLTNFVDQLFILLIRLNQNGEHKLICYLLSFRNRQLWLLLTSSNTRYVAWSSLDDHALFWRLYKLSMINLSSLHCWLFNLFYFLFLNLCYLAFIRLVSNLGTASVQLFKESPNIYVHYSIIFIFMNIWAAFFIYEKNSVIYRPRHWITFA